MRQIKFRGKSVHSGEWVYGNFIHSKRFSGYGNEFRIHCPDTGLESDVVPETVGQFTGLKDSNGVEIFEGDILECTEVDEDSAAGREFTITGEVVFGNGGKSKYVAQYPTSFCVLSGEFYMEQALLGGFRARYEVIGSIHDNPDLL